MRDAIRRRRWRDDESGMSLVEIMIAVFVLSVGLLALASAALTSIVSLRVSEGRQEATNAASAMIEDVRRTDYALVALDANDPDVTALGDCTLSYDEPLVTTSQPGAIPHHTSFGPSGEVTVTTTVSWYDEDGDQPCTDPTHDRSAKRIEVVAEWTDADKSFQLEESTLVAPVDRGLPAPDFRLGTPSASVTFSDADVTNETERCVGHVLRNLGAEDGYEWTAARTDSGSIEKNNAARYWTANGKFYLRAFMENPAQDPPLDPALETVPKDQIDRHANLPPGLELLVDGTDPNTLPDTDSDVATGDQARMWICYWPGSNASVGDTAEFDVTVSSKFDSNRTETVQHSVEVTDDFVDLFLYDDDTSDAGQDGPRAETRPNSSQYLPVLPMGPETSLQPDRLGTAASLPNYDTDLDVRPGTRLASTSTFTDGNEIVFHQQVTPATTFTPTIDLDLWVASDDALADLAAGSATTTSHPIGLNFSLDVLNKNENQVRSTPLSSASHQYVHTDPNWMRRSFQLSLADPIEVRNDEYLRLTIACDETYSEDECHLAYDHVTFPSRLRLVVQ